MEAGDKNKDFVKRNDDYQTEASAKLFEEEEDNNRDNNVDEETCESNKEEYSMVVHQDKPEFIENKRLWSQETGSVHPGAGESSGTPVRMLADQLETQLSHWSGSVSRNCLTRASSRGDVLTEYSDLQLLIPDRDNVDASGNVERFIAVPVSPSYLTDHLRSLHQTSINMSSLQHTPGHRSPRCRSPDSVVTIPPTPCTSLVSAQVHCAVSLPPDCKLPPPSSERLSPIGANSRATSKLSLDNIIDGETRF